MQAGAQRFVAGSHFLLQHWPSVVHAAVRPRHAVGGNVQRGGSNAFLSQRSLLGVARQQPLCEPELHVSPVGRQVELAGST